jgi:hypothetical protein
MRACLAGWRDSLKCEFGLRLKRQFEACFMIDRENKELEMSDCAYCGLTMDFVPDNDRQRFEIECEHCHKINVVSWKIWETGVWYTGVKQD